MFASSSNNFALSMGAGGAGAPTKMTSNIYKCVFANNSGGIAVTGGKENWVTTEITNCTFYRNKLYTFVKSWYPSFDLPDAIYYDKLAIRNCMIWEPGSTPATMFYSNDPQNVNYHHFDIDHSLINFTEAQLGTITGATNALGESNLYAIDPMFVSTDSNHRR